MNRRSSLPARMLLLLGTLLGSVGAVHSQGVQLDLPFGAGGIAMFNPSVPYANARGVVTLDDNTMIFCGSAMDHTYAATGFLMHVLEDGTQDLTFANDGVAELSYGTSTFAYDLIRLSDGKFLVAGVAYPTTPNAEFFVARFNSDGSVDTSFGNGGSAFTDYSEAEEIENAIAVQPDGAIVLAGKSWTGSFTSMLFTRFTADGMLDTAFGDGGYTVIDATIQADEIRDLGLLSDGTIVGVGHQYYSTPYFGERACIVKLDTNGDPMSDFGTGGVYTPPVFDDVSMALGLHIQNDDLYLTGYIYDAENDYNLFLAKLDDQGGADPTFGNSGIVTFKQSAGDHYNLGYDLMIPSADGKIYVCGTSGYGAGLNPRDFIMLRFQADGQLDPTFNGSGYIITSPASSYQEASAMTTQPDGKVVLAGFANVGGTNDAVLARYVVDDLMNATGVPVISPSQVVLRASPNPFSTSTRLSFTLTTARQLELEVFDVAGRRVATASEGFFAAGSHSVAFDSRRLSDGVYLCRLLDGSGTIATEKITVVR